MKVKSGYFKKHLHVDLSTQKHEFKNLSDEFINKYIGGRGFGAKLVWDNLKKNKLASGRPQDLADIENLK